MKLVWTRRARREIEEIWLYLADRSIPYADKVEQRIRRRGDSLGPLPKQGRPLVRDIRRLSITDIQYTIDYRIDEDAVRILRVRSTAQDEKE